MTPLQTNAATFQSPTGDVKGGQESPPSKSPSCLTPSGTEMHTTGPAGTAEN